MGDSGNPCVEFDSTASIIGTSQEKTRQDVRFASEPCGTHPMHAVNNPHSGLPYEDRRQREVQVSECPHMLDVFPADSRRVSGEQGI
jgi:hypothetical protein